MKKEEEALQKQAETAQKKFEGKKAEHDKERAEAQRVTELIHAATKNHPNVTAKLDGQTANTDKVDAIHTVREFVDKITKSMEESLAFVNFGGQPPEVVALFRKVMGDAVFSQMQQAAAIGTTAPAKGVEILAPDVQGSQSSNDAMTMLTMMNGSAPEDDVQMDDHGNP